MNKKILILSFGLVILFLAGLLLQNYKINDNNIENVILEEETSEEEGDENITRKIKLLINDNELTATLVDNSSTDALIEKLETGAITIQMHDYANFEKVGDLGFELPRNDEYITTEAGDLILYQGNSFVIYYDRNSYTFTKLGEIDNINQEELKEILGEEDVEVTIELI